MKYLLVAVWLFASNAFAYYEDPHQAFDMTRNITNLSKIEFIQADNIQATCEKESRKRGFDGFKYAIEACSFWDKQTCTIVTGKRTNMHTIGHEVRHCLQGNFHK